MRNMAMVLKCVEQKLLSPISLQQENRLVEQGLGNILVLRVYTNRCVCVEAVSRKLKKLGRLACVAISSARTAKATTGTGNIEFDIFRFSTGGFILFDVFECVSSNLFEGRFYIGTVFRTATIIALALISIGPMPRFLICNSSFAQFHFISN
eukprot:TRINITY_DN11274_c0_g1_i7.p1 TRINITY_DN11274_c0_g1~~TRINITY_DN11274_c0_g1_i7.p1  ORF type:complete len:152 (-),score=9.94 TRINITY_DN11274_c0_g1_i7:99-554(-)